MRWAFRLSLLSLSICLFGITAVHASAQARLNLRVEDENGRPLAGVRIQAALRHQRDSIAIHLNSVDPPERRFSEEEQREWNETMAIANVVSDGTGRHTLMRQGHREEDYILFFQMEGRFTEVRRVPARGPTETIRVRMFPAPSLQVHLQCGANPCAGARVRLSQEVLRNTFHEEAIADVDGSVLLRGYARGPLQMHVHHRANEAAEAIGEFTLRLSPTLRDPRLQVQIVGGPSTITSRVVDRDGNSVSRAEVQVQCGQAVRWILADDAGAFSASNLPLHQECVVRIERKRICGYSFCDTIHQDFALGQNVPSELRMSVVAPPLLPDS